MSTLEVKAIQAPTGYDLQMPAGSVIQFASKNLIDTFISTSSTYATTHLTIDFTPKFANSTILVQWFGSVYFDAVADHGRGQIRKDGNELTTANQKYNQHDLLAYLSTTYARGGVMSGFWAGDAGSTSQATYAYYMKSGSGSTVQIYKNSGISITEIAG